METIKGLQRAQLAFEAPRKQMQISPIGAMERMEQKMDELYVELVDEPNLWEWGGIASEIADVFLFLCVVANRYGVDIGEATEKKIAQNEQRFPIILFDGSNGKPFKENYEEAKRLEGKPVPKPTPDYSSVDFERDSLD